MIETMEKRKFVFTVACIKEKALWFVTDYTHILCEMDLETHVVHFHTILAHFSQNIRQLIGAMVIENNKIIMAPLEGDDFYIYDIKSKQIKKQKCDVKSARKYYHAVPGDGKVYFILNTKAGFTEYDVKEETFVTHNEFSNIEDKQIDKDRIWSRGEGEVYKGFLYIPLARINQILKINLQNYEFSFMNLEGTEKGYNAVVSLDEMCWAIPRNGGQIKKSADGFLSQKALGQTSQYVFKPTDRIVWAQKKLYILDSENLELYKFNMTDENFEKCSFHIERQEKIPFYIGHRILWMGEWENFLLFEKSEGRLLIWDQETAIGKEYDYLLNDKDPLWDGCMKMLIEGGIVEERDVSLGRLIRYFSEEESAVPIEKVNEEKIGKKIYEIIC